MLAPDGRCKALSAAADGYGRAEACGVLLLQQAGASDGSGPVATLAGSAVNQDGRSSSLTAPNGPSQQEVMRQALGAASLAAVAVAGLSMHGTGTALGDPIEVGAAAAVLAVGSSGSSSNARAALVLMASKSWIGHSEPGAGVVGLTHAHLALARAVKLPVLHLGPMNPYVTALMERQPGSWSVPRQPAELGTLPANEASPDMHAVIGTSAFAFQGTNAHALLAAAPFASARVGPMGASSAWQQQRYWVSPAVHSLLESFRPAKGHKAVLACCLAGATAVGSSGLSYLWDHQVSGRPVFPGAGYFEMAGSATGMLAAAHGSGGPALTEAALEGASIVAPLLLPQPSAAGGAVVLQASYSAADGAVAVQSVQGGSKSRPTLHVDCHVAHTAPGFGRGDRAAVRPAVPQQRQQRLGPSRQLLATTIQQRQAVSFAELARSSHDESAVTVSPAVLDCCLQLAAVPAAGSMLRIPAGVGLLLLGSKPATASAAGHSKSSGFVALSCPSAELVPDDGDATFTDYCLANGSSGRAACTIQEMEARPLGSTLGVACPAGRGAGPGWGDPGTLSWGEGGRSHGEGAPWSTPSLDAP